MSLAITILTMVIMAGVSSSRVVLLCLALLACFTPCSSGNCRFRKSDGSVKGMFVFGSSLVDNGNNNFLDTTSKADFFPYGIDFPGGPSGRFTNGKNVVDLLCDHLKLPLIPPFQDPRTKGRRIVQGVNHASGSAGILDDTSSMAGNVTRLSQQIRNFGRVTLPDLQAQLGCKSSESLPNYIFVIGIGGNDYAFNYFLRKLFLRVGVGAFTSNVIAALSLQLKSLYTLGARKFVLMGISPIGSSPMVQLKQANCIGCREMMNASAYIYNAHLKHLVDEMEIQMPGSNILYVDTYKIIKDINKLPAPKGFTNKTSSCCDVVSEEKGGNGVLCQKGGPVCADRRGHVYFDGLHPTEAVNGQIASKAYASEGKRYVYPINVKQLAQL